MTGTVIVGCIVALAAGLALKSIIQDKKKGRSIQCGCDCGKCRGCH